MFKFFDSFAPKAKPPGPQNNSAILIFLSPIISSICFEPISKEDNKFVSKL